MIDISALMEASKMLDRASVPTKGAAILNRDSFMLLGGTEEEWDTYSKDGLIYLELK